ncbi:caspase family protein [Lichenifustis flavocetrariae]|uniref:Caspase family protein n=1 Tax=Lichenifustis flavocetrariae TaxID=2949735 RepID=A0AA41YW64_9HYPH|nr:caspase family protein [Lichenifustis flavocetrariae]MCW6509696.1 caspase family protein [Lichenifustis flavocetrariae]
MTLIRQRGALVIGNAKYTGPNTKKLRNPVNDATAIATKLKRYGFSLTTVYDGSFVDMRTALDNFRSMIQPQGVALVFFAGHGIQIEGENFIFACDTDASGENQAKYSSLSLNQVIDVLDRSKADTKIVILDACRENPFEAAWHRSGSNRGLASVFAPRGTIIAFATSPGQIAADGLSSNGVYTGALLQHIDVPDIPIETLFKRVRNTVAADTGGKQVTWEHTSLAGDFYFNTSSANIVTRYASSSLSDNLFVPDPGKASHQIIRGLKSIDWYIQNPALDRLTPKLANTVKDETLFVLGRNIYQAAHGGARSAEAFIRNLVGSTSGMKPEKIRALLDGILFEIFFNSKGELREEIKGNMFNDAFDLQKLPQFKDSFDFIAETLVGAHADFYRVPGKGHALSVTVVTKANKRGSLVTGVFIDTVDVLRLKDPEYAVEEDEPMLARSLSQSDFEEELAKELIIPKRLLQVRYTPALQPTDTIRYRYGWGVSKK